jgi:hypothetical protein
LIAILDQVQNQAFPLRETDPQSPFLPLDLRQLSGDRSPFAFAVAHATP